MRHWVIDTNVVVSGFLSPEGPPARILDAIQDGRISLVYDARILAEYRDVLHRPRLKVRTSKVREFLEALQSQLLVTPVPVTGHGPDPDDIIFVEAALAAVERTIVTGNLGHYPERALHGTRVLTPAQALKELEAG